MERDPAAEHGRPFHPPEYYQRIADNGNRPRADPSPWHPMSDPVDLKHLGKLGEELGEGSAAVSRCVIQGIDEAEPVTGRVNRTWLEDELADIMANTELCVEHFGLDIKRMRDRAERKKSHLRAWHRMA
jgi:hypothetical protein